MDTHAEGTHTEGTDTHTEGGHGSREADARPGDGHGHAGRRHLPSGSAARGAYAVDIDPERVRLGALGPPGGRAGAGRCSHPRHRRERMDRPAVGRWMYGAYSR